MKKNLQEMLDVVNADVREAVKELGDDTHGVFIVGADYSEKPKINVTTLIHGSANAITIALAAIMLEDAETREIVEDALRIVLKEENEIEPVLWNIPPKFNS